MNTFLDAFWPNLASTVLGLILGLPIALWTNRKIMAHVESQKEREDRLALLHTLDVISRALEHNRGRLRYMHDSISGGRVPFDPALDYSAWDASKEGFNPSFTDPQLRQALAYHFSRMQSIARLNETYLSYAAGIASAIGGSEGTRDALKNYLSAITAELASDAETLIQQIASARGALLPRSSATQPA